MQTPVHHLRGTATGTAVHILLVEDSPSDIALTVNALREGHIANELDVATDGEQALAFLRREGEFATAPTPDLILLDLNLPRKDGREVLAEVKADPELELIPLIVLTTSSSEADILQTYHLHANAFVTKPVALDDFMLAIRSIEDFWLSVVRLPGRKP